MQSFQRAITLFSITLMGLFAGCGGPGAPVSGSSDPAEESANAALAPEGGVPATATKSEGDAAAAAPESNATTEAAAGEPKADSKPVAPQADGAPESGS